MSRYIPEVVRQRVRAAAADRCGYCLTDQTITGMPLHIEHIIPLAAGGTNAEENLWLACALCNGYKGAQREHLDPQSGETVSLFNPREQQWNEHFAWRQGGVLIEGTSAVGRATTIALQLNNIYLTRARRRWIMVGWHPPS